MPAKKKTAHAPKFRLTNLEEKDGKPGSIRHLIRILDKMDAAGFMSGNDLALILVEGDSEGMEERTVDALGLTEKEKTSIDGFAILDGPIPDDAESATGRIFGLQQLIELSYAMGCSDEAAHQLRSATSAAGVKDEDEPSDEETDEDDEENEDEDDGEDHDDADPEQDD